MEEAKQKRTAESAGENAEPSRRGFAARAVMTGGLVAGYGAFAAIAARFLYPARATERRWLFVTRADEMKAGDSLDWRTPAGARVTIARRGMAGAAEDFVALSSTCPHLGCQVHWEGHRERFFCPCHNGVFDPDGVALSGPPADAGQRLSAYPLRIDDGLLYIEVPVERLAQADDARHGPGHDPCLGHRFGQKV